MSEARKMDRYIHWGKEGTSIEPNGEWVKYSDAQSLADENARLQKRLGAIDDELVNLLPHIPQACYPGHQPFIDAHVEQAIKLARDPAARYADEELETENARLRACLELLHSVQNGCPLHKYEKDWNEAMAEAEKLLRLGSLSSVDKVAKTDQTPAPQ